MSIDLSMPRASLDDNQDQDAFVFGNSGYGIARVVYLSGPAMKTTPIYVQLDSPHFGEHVVLWQTMK